MAVILPSTATPAVASLAQYQGGAALVRGGGRGGGAHGNPPFYAPRDDAYNHQPPVGVVVGAGAVGALAGHIIFNSLLISAGLGVGAMGLAASSDNRAGEIARSSGRMALAAFDRTAEVNDRYRLTDRLVDSARTAGWRLKELDREHAVVHRATEGAKHAWRDLRKFDETHELTSRAGNVVSQGLDKLAEALQPPANPSEPVGQNSRRRDKYDRSRPGSDGGGGRGGGGQGSGGSWTGGGGGGGKGTRGGGNSDRMYSGPGDDDEERQYRSGVRDNARQHMPDEDHDDDDDDEGSTLGHDLDVNSPLPNQHDNGWIIMPPWRGVDGNGDGDGRDWWGDGEDEWRI